MKPLRRGPALATHEAKSEARPTLRERILALAGETTWREPVEGRCAREVRVPAAHTIAATLAFARRGPDDISPDIALAIALGSDYRRSRIVALLAGAMRMDRHPLTRRNIVAMDYVATAAFDAVVHNRARTRPLTITEKDWDMLVPCAARVLEALADAVIAEAEHKWRRV